MTKTIMIVDDEKYFHDLYKTMLKDTDYKLIHTYDGYEAMEKLEEVKPDLVIIDVIMSLVTGDTLFLYLKSITEYVDIPVIIISAYSEQRFKSLKNIDPDFISIEKSHLTRERLLDAVKRKLPKNKNTTRVTFRLPKDAAPDANSVYVVGDFNNWDINANPMKKMEDGFYSTAFYLEPGKEYQYRYLIDKSKWENDWNASKYVKSPYGDCYNSVIIARN
ncbi:MAG: response regulator [Candidatus Scalindua sp.]|nr:response regulator [Candidatus Scalindua sp.]